MTLVNGGQFRPSDVTQTSCLKNMLDINLINYDIHVCLILFCTICKYRDSSLMFRQRLREFSFQHRNALASSEYSNQTASN